MIGNLISPHLARLPARLGGLALRFTALGALALGGITAHSAVDNGPVIGKTYAQSRAAPAPKPPNATGAPNILVILLDDTGFGSTSTFGGVIETPTLDELADNGLRYTNFHTTGICSPTRAALLTGRNHHNVGMGLFPHKFLSAEFPGYTGRLDPKDGTIAEYLRNAGYSTYALGKWHLTPDEELSNLGPFDRWPTGKGFDHFFGFLGGAEDQYKPDLVEDLQHVKPDGRHLNAQLVDKAISYIDQQQQLAPEKPFFMYFATGATHSPHQVDQPWLDKHKGKFDAGWDVFRQQVFERQKRLGIIPKNAVLPERDPRVPAWDSLSDEQKAIYARFMEAYAAFLDYTDHEIGRLVKHLESQKLLDNTAIFVIIGDNGSSKEGGEHGLVISEGERPSGDDAVQLAELKNVFDGIGTASTYSNFPIGWAQATNTPFRYWKSDANAEGGTRNPLIVHWPKSIKSKGIRTQYGHVIDLLPTALEIAQVSAPKTLRGVEQTPVQGISLAYSFNDAKAATRHTQQYYFILGGGAIVKDGWKASFSSRPDFHDLFRSYPMPKNVENPAGKEKWALYNLNEDFNERIDLSAKHPEKLAELQALFDQEAKANNVYPLINWVDIFSRGSGSIVDIPTED